jgi:hypothetical protein
MRQSSIDSLHNQHDATPCLLLHRGPVNAQCCSSATFAKLLQLPLFPSSAVERLPPPTHQAHKQDAPPPLGARHTLYILKDPPHTHTQSTLAPATPYTHVTWWVAIAILLVFRNRG